MFGFTKSKFPIGLDISDLSLKFIQLKKRGKKIEIQSVGKKKLPKGIIENGLIINQEAALKALKELFAKPIYGNTASNEIVACLPDTKTFIKLINVEKGPNDIADIINTEIEKNVPLGVKDIYYDWQEVASDGQNQQILIGAAPKQIVNQYIDLINKTKYKIAALEIESTAICRSLLKEETPKFDIQQAKNYILIDVGAKRTSLTAYSLNTIVMSISIPISGDEITKTIAETLEIDNEQAEKAKIICGLDKTKAQGIVNNILSDMIKKIIARINEATAFLADSYPDRSHINEILLCGGGANIKNFAQIINEAVKIPAQNANAFINLNRRQNISSFGEEHSLKTKLSKISSEKKLILRQDSSLSYATAIGLALRNIFLN